MTTKKTPPTDRLERIKAALRGERKTSAAAAPESAVEDLAIDQEKIQVPPVPVAEEASSVGRAKPPKSKRHWIHRILKRPAKTPKEPPDALPADPDETKAWLHEQAARRAEVDAGLEKIYLERDGKLPDLSRLQRFRSTAIVRWLVGTLIFLGVISAAAWAGFLFWEPYRDVSSDALHLSIQGPSSIALGREELFEFSWTNTDVQPLAHAEIRLGLPHDFTPTSFEPPPTDKDLRQWRLGIVHVGAEGKIRVRGIFTGALGSENAVQVIGVFRPTAYSKDLQSLATRAVTYDRTALEGSFHVPDKAVAGDAVTLSYALVNRGNQPMRDLYARLTYPLGFLPNIPTSTKQDLAARTLLLPLPELPVGATRTVDVVGTFVSGASGELPVTGEAGRLGPDGRFLTAERTDASVPVLSGDLTLHFVANGSDADRSLQPGEPVRLALNYQNTSPEPIKGIVLTVGFESFVNGVSATGTSLLDWVKLEDSATGATSTKTRLQTLTYAKAQIPALEQLAPQSEGTVEVTLPTFKVASGTKDAAVRLTVQAFIPMVGDTKVNRTVRAQPITLRYRTDADLAVEARAFTEEGAPLGFGPLPPVVGKTTAYRIFWSFSKTLHPVQGMTVSAVLPKASAWSARTDTAAGTMSYDDASRTVKWTLNDVPEGVNELEANFEVQLTPEALDAGRFAALLGETRLEATDPVVGEPLVRVKPPLSTDLQNDDGARGKGVVKKE
jgi:hypothetical protein